MFVIMHTCEQAFYFEWNVGIMFGSPKTLPPAAMGLVGRSVPKLPPKLVRPALERHEI